MPLPAAPAVCGWRWCGGVFWLGRGMLCSVYWILQPQRSRTMSPSSPTLLYLFSGARKEKGKGLRGSFFFFFFFREKFPRSYFFTSSTWHKKCGLNWKSSNSPMTVSKKGGITRLSGSHWHQATWEPESFSWQTQAREKQTPETGGFVQDYYHNHQQRDSSP